MRRLVTPSLLCAVVGLGVWLGASGVASGTAQVSAHILVARPGDKVLVGGTPIACRVVRVRELEKRVAFDCRRSGPLPGTYGTLLTKREAVLVKFESASEAKVVAFAPHSDQPRKCGVG